MKPLVVAVLMGFGIVGGFALLVYMLCRAVSAAKKAGRTSTVGQIVGIFVTLLPGVIVPVPPPETPAETRKVKRNQDGSGDPPD